MIEVVFGESASGSLKVAQGYGRGKYQGGAVSVFIRNTDGTKPTEEEVQAAKFQAEEEARRDWENAIPLDSRREDVYRFDMVLSVGNISDDGLGEQRKNVLRWLLSIDYIKDVEHQVEAKMQNIANALASVMERYGAGEEVRIWYSDNPDEMCGMYWFMTQLYTLKSQTAIYLVKLPEWEYGKENTVISRHSWGDVAPSEWGRYTALQEEVRSTFLSVCAMKWRQLREENASLRAVLNGQIQSVQEDIYDNFILREIAAQKDEFKMAVLIGNVIGKYQLGISDVWVAKRIEKMIENGMLEVIEESPDGKPGYRRVLRKRMK